MIDKEIFPFSAWIGHPELAAHREASPAGTRDGSVRDASATGSAGDAPQWSPFLGTTPGEFEVADMIRYVEAAEGR